MTTAMWSVFGGVVLPTQSGDWSVDVRSVPLTGANADPAVSRTKVTADGISAAGASIADPAEPGWTASVELTNGAQMVGLEWPTGDAAEFEVRNHSATGWTEWSSIDGLADETSDEGAHAAGREHASAGPVWLGHGADRVEVKVVEGRLPDLTMKAIRVDPPGGGVGIRPASASTNFPGIISRADWGARNWATNSQGGRIEGCPSSPTLVKVRFAVIHHTASGNSYGPADSYAIMRGIQAFHMDGNGWCDIGYNFVVDKYGQIFEGRAGGWQNGPIGGHARGFNTSSTGISLLGTYSAVQPSTAQTNSLRNLLNWKFALHGIDANGSIYTTSQCDVSFGDCLYPPGQTVLLPTIIGHRDVVITDCPGNGAYPLVSVLRPQVAANVITSGPFNYLPRWTPQAGAPRALTLDALGGIHPAGSATAVPTASYPGFSILRGIAGTATGGYVVDGFGGVYAYGGAPAPWGMTAYWRGWDIARGIALTSPTAGYALDALGALHPFGGAPPPAGGPYWRDWDIARGVATIPGAGASGYVLDGWGGVHRFGSAPPAAGAPYFGFDIARAIAANPGGPGGYVLDGWGGVHPFGGAPPLRVHGYHPRQDVFRGLTIFANGMGYAVDIYGVAWPVGSAPPLEHSLTWTGFPIARGVVAG